MTTTAFAAAARQANATKIASALIARRPALAWLSAGIERAPESFRLLAAQQAGITTAVRDGKAPSEATWSIVIDQLRADVLFGPDRAPRREHPSASLMCD